MDYMGNPSVVRANVMGPSSQVIVRPSGKSSSISPLTGWFDPSGDTKSPNSDDPDYASPNNSFSSIVTSASFGLANNSLGDPTVEIWGVGRFLSPHGDDIDPDGAAGGYWCLRSDSYYVAIDSLQARGQVYYGETGYSLGGMRVEAWLLDTYFDRTNLSWNNRSNITISGYKIDFYISATEWVEEALITGNYRFKVNMPQLKSGGYPKIYGTLLRVIYEPAYPLQPDPTPEYEGDVIPLNHSGEATMVVLAHQMNDRRGADPENNLKMPTTRAPLYYNVGGGGWAVDPPLLGGPYLGAAYLTNIWLFRSNGYQGEWEDLPYIPKEPYVFGRWIGAYPPHYDYLDQPNLVLCAKNGSVDFTLVAASWRPNSELTWLITTPVNHGTVTGTGPDYTYTPPVDFTGTAYFEYKVRDADSRLSHATRVYLYVS